MISSNPKFKKYSPKLREPKQICTLNLALSVAGVKIMMKVNQTELLSLLGGKVPFSRLQQLLESTGWLPSTVDSASRRVKMLMAAYVNKEYNVQFTKQFLITHGLECKEVPYFKKYNSTDCINFEQIKEFNLSRCLTDEIILDWENGDFDLVDKIAITEKK